MFEDNDRVLNTCRTIIDIFVAIIVIVSIVVGIIFFVGVEINDVQYNSVLGGIIFTILCPIVILIARLFLGLIFTTMEDIKSIRNKLYETDLEQPTSEPNPTQGSDGDIGQD